MFVDTIKDCGKLIIQPLIREMVLNVLYLWFKSSLVIFRRLVIISLSLFAFLSFLVLFLHNLTNFSVFQIPDPFLLILIPTSFIPCPTPILFLPILILFPLTIMLATRLSSSCHSFCSFSLHSKFILLPDAKLIQCQ